MLDSKNLIFSGLPFPCVISIESKLKPYPYVELGSIRLSVPRLPNFSWLIHVPCFVAPLISFVSGSRHKKRALPNLSCSIMPCA